MIYHRYIENIIHTVLLYFIQRDTSKIINNNLVILFCIKKKLKCIVITEENYQILKERLIV